MSKKSLRDLHNQLSWNTKIYTLLAISVVLIAKFTNALQNDFALSIILALLIVLFVESFAMISIKHPRQWQYIKWTVILAVLALLLLGFLNF